MVLAIRCVVLMPDKDEIFIDFCIGIFNLHQTNKGSPFCRAAFVYNLLLRSLANADNNNPIKISNWFCHRNRHVPQGISN